jgi:hypothetical protein
MKAVPRILNLGTPIRYDGMGTSRNGAPVCSSAVLGRPSVPGLSIITLNTPASDSCTGVW